MTYVLKTEIHRVTVSALAFVLLFTLTAAAAEPTFRLSRHLTDDAVLQRDKPVLIRGFAKAGAEIEVKFAGQIKKTKADADGTWSVTLDAMQAQPAGSPLTAQDSTGNQVVINNIVVGDVYLVARQSYVDVSLGRTEQGKSVAKNMTVNPMFRVMEIEMMPSVEPKTDLDADATSGWAIVNPTTASTMSGTAFFFGRDLVAQIDIPVGIIDLDMGPNFTLAWLDHESLLNMQDFFDRRTHVNGYAEWHKKSYEKYLSQQGQPRDPKDRDWVDSNPIEDPMYPAAGYNAVLHPLRGLALKGVLLQLGNDYPYMAYEALRGQTMTFDRPTLDKVWWEAYLHRKNGYRAAFDVLPRVPVMWRSYFNNKQLPIAMIMPPSSANPTYAIHNREVREFQRQVASQHDKIGLILPGNDHIPFSGQPADDVLVAERSLSWVLSSIYDRKDVAPSGPLVDRVETKYNTAEVFFKPGTAKGLKAAAGSLDSFEAAGIDGVFYPVQAEIDGETVKLISSEVSRIQFVRYNFNSRPDQGLTNSSNLPAIPFYIGKDTFIDVPRYTESTLPPEYSTPADKWGKGEIAIVSGGGASYRNSTGWLGPIGIKVKPFGPNMQVIQVLPGSPADGIIENGDMIYQINGAYLGDDHVKQVGMAIDQAESKAGQGKIKFALRRGTELRNAELKLEVLGSYSITSPYDCPKVDRLIENSEKYLAERGGLASGYAGGGWLHSDTMFLLGAGTPEYQGYVRRFIYNKMAEMDRNSERRAGGNAWHQGHGTLLFAEYYLATGDQNVLPYLDSYCKHFLAMQATEGTFEDMPERSIGGWRHNYPGGQWYGMIPNIGLPGMIGLLLAKEAGVDVDETGYELGMHFFRDHQAEMGFVDYAASMPMRMAPEPINPQKLSEGMLYARNGGRGMSAILYGLNDETRTAHLNSSYCAFAYNNCHEGHGSNFFNGLWTPLGAKLQGRDAFVNFMKKHYWYRDLKRMYTHISLPARGDAPSAGHDLVLVVPRERLRILGAGESVFASNASDIYQPALKAYHARDYKKAEEIMTTMIDSGKLPVEEQAKAQQLQQAAIDMQKSIATDMARVQKLIAEGKLYEASLDLPQLQGVVAENDPRLAKIRQVIESADGRTMNEQANAYKEHQQTLTLDYRKAGTPVDAPGTWQPITTEVGNNPRVNIPGLVPEEQATTWRVKVIEAVSQAPQDWEKPGFDDSTWGTTSLPISWHLNHSFLARTTFTIDDVKDIDALRVSCHPFRQLNIVVYINGNVVAKFNESENNKGWVHGDLPPAALKHLRQGENTLAFSTTHDWRWATRGGVDNGGFGLILLKSEKE